MNKVRKMTIVLRMLLLGFSCYLVLVLMVFFFQKRMLYMPYRTMNGSPSDIGLSFREVSFKTSDHVSISGWFVGQGKDRDVVLFCHGNAGNISHRLDSFYIFDYLGLDTFIFDYRGYGKSGGSPSEKGTYLDIEAAWRYLVETEHIKPERIILFGRSLGGAVAARQALNVNAKALVLESTFTSVPDVGVQVYPFLPVRLLSRYRYDTRSILPRIHLPVLVVHSPNDEIIPYSHGKALFETANEPKQFLKISGSHNEGFINSKEIYIDGFKKFLKSCN
jgi:hypothetical protein